jgi:hypothetical protein
LDLQSANLPSEIVVSLAEEHEPGCRDALLSAGGEVVRPAHRYLNEQLVRSSRRSAATSGFAGVKVIADARRGPAAALSLGGTLVDHVMKARATARKQASVISDQ